MAKTSYVQGALTGPSKKVFIATPTYTGKVDNGYLHSLLLSMPLLQKAGIGFDFYQLSYHCHVDDARNAIVRDFLSSDCSELIFIDADVAWDPQALVKLCLYDRDIVAGVYPKRSKFDREFPVVVGQGVTLRQDHDGLVEVDGAPTGFMKIKRHVLEKMAELNKNRRFLGTGEAPDARPYTIIFERTYVAGRRFGGDLNFCRVWQNMGGKIFVDPEMDLIHIGEVEFDGTLGEFWREKHGVNQKIKERDQEVAIKSLLAGTCNEEILLKLHKAWGNPYAATIELLSVCDLLAKETKGPILETGSGLSTLILAAANPKAEIHVLEHDPVWASHMNYLLQIHNIKNVSLHFVPLKDYKAGKWYDISTLPEIDFSLVLCDGPPRLISNRNILFGELGRYFLDAVVLMDDADNDEATFAFNFWAKQCGRGELSILGSSRRFAISKPKEKPKPLHMEEI